MTRCTTSEYEKQIITRIRFALRNSFVKSEDDQGGLFFEFAQLILEGDEAAISTLFD